MIKGGTMKAISIALLSITVLFAVALLSTTVLFAVPVNKKVVKRVEFEQAIGSIQNNLKVQVNRIQKTKQGHENLLKKIDKESADLKQEEETAYKTAKDKLKEVYDKEMAEIAADEKALQEKKQKIEAAYQAALKSIEELCSPPKK